MSVQTKEITGTIHVEFPIYFSSHVPIDSSSEDATNIIKEECLDYIFDEMKSSSMTISMRIVECSDKELVEQ